MSVAIVLVQRDANRRSEFPYDKGDAHMPQIFDLIQKHLATLIALLTNPPVCHLFHLASHVMSY
jgi:hypothetical protein